MRKHQNLLAYLDTLGPELRWLRTEIMEEVNDINFTYFRHGERHTRNRGCTGPLCKKSLRDWMAARVRTLNDAQGLETRPHRKSAKYTLINPLLDQAKLAHDKDQDERNGTLAQVS